MRGARAFDARSTISFLLYCSEFPQSVIVHVMVVLHARGLAHGKCLKMYFLECVTRLRKGS